MTHNAIYLGDFRKSTDPEANGADGADIIFLGEEPSGLADYDLVVISSLTEALSSTSMDLIGTFFREYSGNILWIYDERFQGISGDFVEVSDFHEVNDIEGFIKPDGVTSDIADGIIDMATDVTMSNLGLISARVGKTVSFIKRFEGSPEAEVAYCAVWWLDSVGKSYTNFYSLSGESQLILKYTGTDASRTVNVTASYINSIGTTNPENFQFDFITYTTIEDVVNAIEALPNWECYLSDAEGDTPSTDLVVASRTIYKNIEIVWGSQWGYLGYIHDIVGSYYYGASDPPAMCDFNGTIYTAIRGSHSSLPTRLYYSSDCTSWNYYTLPLRGVVIPKNISLLFAYNGKMYGAITYGNFETIYSTTDGSTWVEELVLPYVDYRDWIWLSTMIEFNGELFVAGGYSYATLYYPPPASGGWECFFRIYKSDGGGTWTWVETKNNLSLARFCKFNEELYMGTSPGATLYKYNTETGVFDSVFATFTIGGAQQTVITELVVHDGIFYAYVAWDDNVVNWKYYNENIYLWKSYDGTNWSLVQQIATKAYSPGYTGRAITYRGSQYFNDFATGGSYYVYTYKTDYVAPAQSDHFNVPSTWLNKGNGFSAIAPDKVVFRTSRQDIGFGALVVSYDGNDLDYATNGRFIFVGDSNMFTNNGAHFDRGRNADLIENIMQYALNGKNRILWLAGEWDDTMLILTYFGADTNRTITVDATTLYSTGATVADNFSIDLATYPTIGEVRAAILVGGPFDNWTCALGVYPSTDPSSQLEIDAVPILPGQSVAWHSTDYGAVAERRGWMDIESTEDYGAKNFADGVGIPFTQLTTGINEFIEGGGLGFLGAPIRGHPSTILLGSE